MVEIKPTDVGTVKYDGATLKARRTGKGFDIIYFEGDKKGIVRYNQLNTGRKEVFLENADAKQNDFTERFGMGIDAAISELVSGKNVDKELAEYEEAAKQYDKATTDAANCATLRIKGEALSPSEVKAQQAINAASENLTKADENLYGVTDGQGTNVHVQGQLNTRW